MKKEVNSKEKKNIEVKNKNKKVKKNDNIVLCVLGCVIVLLLIITIVVRNSDYYNTKTYTYDYFKFLVSDYYEKSDKQRNYLIKNDESCYIEYNSLITEKNDLLNYGELIKINDHDWVKQDFDNGVTWMSYYKNSFYIIQMYGKDNVIYENECKQDFDKIKSTFSFIKSE